MLVQVRIFFYFDAAFHTKLFKTLVKKSDSYYIYGSVRDNFQMIIFDIINFLFKCWTRLEVFYFDAAVHTKLYTIIAKQSDSSYIHGR